jgi:hypothetical protein
MNARTELSRRGFLKTTGLAVAGLSTLKSNPAMAADAKAQTVAVVRGPELGLKPHSLRVGDGAGGWTWQPAEFRFLHAPDSMLMPFGLAQMENGEVALLGAVGNEKTPGNKQTACAAFSSDGGSTWTDWHLVPDAPGRPMGLADLGGGKLSFYTNKRFFSSDYGRTWPEQVKIPPAVEGEAISGTGWGGEGSPLVERDAAGNIAIAELGYQNLANYPAGPTINYFRWSRDGGRTWEKAVSPKEWLWEDSWEGKTHVRGVSEGSVVRAKNGWLVAALRTDMPARWIATRNDNYEGCAVSISKDNGQSWSPLQVLHRGGRMHMHFVRMPDGALVMIYVMRQDIAPDGVHYASYRRGCGALVSLDHGLTWDLTREYLLHEFDFATPKEGAHEGISALACGHTCSTLLKDGSILTAYGHYTSKGIALIRWRLPAKRAVRRVRNKPRV